MKALSLLGAAALLTALATSASAQNLAPAVTSAQIVTGASVTAAAPRFLAKDSSGNLIFSNQTASSNADFRIVRVALAGPTFTVLANAADLSGAITTAGGTPPASVTVRGMAVTANDNVILATDDATGSFLFRITGPGAVQLLSGLQTPNTIDGVNRMGALGNNVYVLCNGAFAVAPQDNDHIQVFDVTATANGIQPGTVLVNEAALIAGIPGSTAATINLNAPTALNATTLFLANSGGAAQTDELITVTSAGAVTQLKDRTTLLAAVADTDVGWGAAAYDAVADTVYITNPFGGAATDDDIIQVTSGGTGTVSTFVTDATLEADIDWPGGNLSYNGDGLTLLASKLYFTDFTTNAIWSIDLPSDVADWQLYN